MQTVAELLTIVEATLERVDYGFLITAAPDGPDARLVKHLDVDEGLGVWFGTSARSRKARQIGDGAMATFAAEDRTNYAYVTLKGQARVVADVRQRREHWQDGLAMFFPDGPASDEFTLISLDTHRIELMSFAAKVHPEPLGLVPAALDRTPTGWASVEPERH